MAQNNRKAEPIAAAGPCAARSPFMTPAGIDRNMLRRSDVGFGSEPDVGGLLRNAGFGPESGHLRA